MSNRIKELTLEEYCEEIFEYESRKNIAESKIKEEHLNMSYTNLILEKKIISGYRKNISKIKNTMSNIVIKNYRESLLSKGLN